MALKVLTKSQVDHFIERGWVRVEEAFSEEDALAAQAVVWEHVEERGPKRNDNTTWTQPMVHIKESYDTPEFQRCSTRRLADAIEDLVGEGRWANRVVYGETDRTSSWGWWPVNFSVGAEDPWTVPDHGWHWDGIHFRHFVDSPEQGLLCLCMFSETASTGGATMIAEGSHHVVAQYLASKPDGMKLEDAIGEANTAHPWLARLTGSDKTTDRNSKDPYATEEHGAAASEAHAAQRRHTFLEQTYEDPQGFSLHVAEALANPGDVYLCHPFLYHAATQNKLRVPRFMCNRTTPLRSRMNLNRANAADYSPLERSVRHALDVSRTR